MIKRLIASFLVLVSGMILLSDIFVDYYGIEIANRYGFTTTSNFVYWISMMISQLLLIIATQFKPYRISYLAPIYLISLSIYWIMFSGEFDNKSYFNIYVFGFSLLLLAILSLISMLVNKEKIEAENKNAKLKLLENIFDLTVLKIKKSR